MVPLDPVKKGPSERLSMDKLLCSPSFPVTAVLGSCATLVGLLAWNRLQIRRGKDGEFDWNRQLLTALSLLAILSLLLFFVYTLFVTICL